jgi:FG-GAP-like repeat
MIRSWSYLSKGTLAALVVVLFAFGGNYLIDVGPSTENFGIKSTYQSVSGVIQSIAASSDGQRVYAGTYAGVWRSDDGGRNWRQLTRPQPDEGTTEVRGALGTSDVFDLVVSPVNKDLVLAAAIKDTHVKSREGIYRSSDGGDTWSIAYQFTCANNLLTPVAQIVFAPDDPNLVYAAAGCVIGISKDGGATWAEKHLQGEFAYHIAVAPQEGAVRRVYAIGSGKLIYSENAGESWVSAGVAFSEQFGEPLGDGGAASSRVLVVEPGHPKSILLAVPNFANGPSYYHQSAAQLSNLPDGTLCNKPVIYDANNNDLFDAGDNVIAGTDTAMGVKLRLDLKLRYVDANTNGGWDASEAVVYDSNNDSKMDFGDSVITATSPKNGLTLKNDPKIKHVDLGAPFEPRFCGEGSLWEADFSKFDFSNPNKLKVQWRQLPGPPVYYGESTDSGNSYIAVQPTPSGYLLFLSDRSHVHVSEGMPTSHASWHRLDGRDLSKSKKDGKSDLAAWNPTSHGWNVAVSNGGGFDPSADAGGGAWIRDFGSVDAGYMLTGDFDGDGLTDIASWEDATAGWKTALSKGRHFDDSVGGHGGTWIKDFGGPFPGFMLAGDFNGDGKTDIAGWNEEHKGWHVALSTGKGFDPSTEGGGGFWADQFGWPFPGYTLVGDFNGDGRADIAGWNTSIQGWHVALSTGRSFDPSAAGGGGFWTDNFGQPNQGEMMVGDFTGDGKADIAGWNSSAVGWHVAVSTGKRFDPTPQGGGGIWISSFDSHFPGIGYTGDFNGDGKTDIAAWWGSTHGWIVALSTGKSFFLPPEPARYWISNFGNPGSMLIGNFNGDSDLRNDVFVHVDPHAIAFSADFNITLKSPSGLSYPYDQNKVLDKYLGGTIFMANDGGVYRSTDGGASWSLGSGLATLQPQNIAGLSKPGHEPALYMGLGHNDNFFSLNGGKVWGDPVNACGDCGPWFADPAQPSRVLEIAGRDDPRALALYTEDVVFHNYPDPSLGVYRKSIPLPGGCSGGSIPPCPDGEAYVVGSNASADYPLARLGDRPIVLTTSGESPEPDGDYVIIRYRTDGKRVVLRTKKLSSITQIADWNDVAKVTQQGPVLPQNVGPEKVTPSIVQASGGHTNTVFYVGDLELSGGVWKWTSGMSNWQLIVSGGTPGHESGRARRFFASPYDSGLIYIIDGSAIKRSNDGGASWDVDTNLQNAVSERGEFSVDSTDAIIKDMVFDRNEPNTRFAIGNAGVFYTIDGVNWKLLLSTTAMPGHPISGYFDSISDPCKRTLYVAFDGRGVIKVGPIPPLCH